MGGYASLKQKIHIGIQENNIVLHINDNFVVTVSRTKLSMLHAIQ